MSDLRQNRTRQHLERLQQQFPVTQQIGSKPEFLQYRKENATAFAHSMRLAAFDYPLAFGRGYRKHSIKNNVSFFNQSGTDVAVIGEDRRILGGVALHRHIAHGWDMEPTDEYASVAYLFRFRDSKIPGVDHVGKTLLGFGLDRLAATTVRGVKLEVVSSNTPALQLYTDIGFEPVSVGYTSDGSHKLVAMMLRGRDSILEAHDKLQAQL